MAVSFSQLGQDLKVLQFYNNKTNGFFIEIGASNGIQLSNTYLLEKDYNWKGICVEPIPYNFKSLCKNRPNSKCYSNPIYNESNLDVTFAISYRSPALSGIYRHIDRYKKEVDSNKFLITLKTLSFNDLLERSNAPSFIEYLSLDTEGSEFEILKSVDFEQYAFGLIDVEHNYIEPRRTQIKELLTSNGYVYLRENKCDDTYKHKSL